MKPISAFGRQNTIKKYRREFIKTLTIGSLGVVVSGSGYRYEQREQSVDNHDGIKLLLSRLDPDHPGILNIMARGAADTAASNDLLRYFRERESVNHPVERTRDVVVPGSLPSENDLEAADNALRHIFIGQGAYPPFFAGEDIDWGLRPVPDNEWVWQFNRMSFWNSMGRAYRHTGDEKYAGGWVYQLTDWVRKNPNDSDHRYAWRSIEAGIRGHSWTGHYQMFIDSPHFTPEVLLIFLNSLYDHASYLYKTYSKGSNWGLMEAEGMAFIAITFPEFAEAEMWRNEAFRRLSEEINIQVHPDGHQKELAMGYHLGCIAWFMRTYDLAAMNGMEHVFPGTYIKSVERMCDVPMKLCHPDGTNPQFGDAWAGRPGQHRSRFLQWAGRFERNDFLFLATGGLKGLKPTETAFALKDSGLYSMRSGWDRDAVCLVLKCGPDGGWHSQPDNGTFELSAGGRTLMPDSGCYIYSGDPENRAWFRQTRVHQTITLNGENSVYAPKLLLWQPDGDHEILIVENAGYPGLIHRRALFFIDRKYFVIVDEAYGSAIGEINLHFQFAAGRAVLDPLNLSARSDFNDGWNVLVKAAGMNGMMMEEEEGQVSFVYTQKEPRPAFCYRQSKVEGKDGVRFVTVVAPYLENIPGISAGVKGDPPVGGSGIEIELNLNGVPGIIGYSLG